MIALDILRSLVAGINNLKLAVLKNADAVVANTQAHKKSTEQKHEQPPLPGPVVVKLETPVAVTIENAPTTNPQDAWQRRDWTKFALELAGFFVLVWYANTTRNLLIESRAQTVAQINASRMDQRAWLKVIGSNFTWDTARPMKVPIEIENFGKTQALHVFAYVVPNLLPLGEMPKFNYERGFPREVMQIGVLSPLDADFRDNADILPSIIDPGKPFVRRIPTLADLDDLAQGRTTAVISGQIWYDDIFGVHHWLKYCYTSPIRDETATAMAGCSDYNAVDGEQEYPNASKSFKPPTDGWTVLQRQPPPR